MATAVALKSTLCRQHMGTELPGSTMTCTLMCYHSRTDGFLVRIIRFFKAGSNWVLLDLYFFTGFLVSAVYIWITGYSENGSSENLLAGILFLMILLILLIVMVESALFSTQEVHWFMWVVISISLWKTSDNIRTRLLNRIDLYFSKKIHITHYRWKGYREKNISNINGLDAIKNERSGVFILK